GVSAQAGFSLCVHARGGIALSGPLLFERWPRSNVSVRRLEENFFEARGDTAPRANTPWRFFRLTAFLTVASRVRPSMRPCMQRRRFRRKNTERCIGSFGPRCHAGHAVRQTVSHFVDPQPEDVPSHLNEP